MGEGGGDGTYSATLYATPDPVPCLEARNKAPCFSDLVSFQILELRREVPREQVLGWLVFEMHSSLSLANPALHPLCFFLLKPDI